MGEHSRNIFKKQLIPVYKRHPEFYKNLLIIIIYLVLPFLFFKDAFHINSIVYGQGDTIALGLPTRQLLINSLKNFQFPLWNPYNNNGIPFFADIQTSSLYPINIIIGLIFPLISAYNISLFLHYSLAGIFTYFFIKEYKISKIAAFTAGILFMFCGFMIIRKVHSIFIYVSTWVPLILYFIEKFVKTKKIKFIFIGSIFCAIQVFAGNPQIILYCFSIEIAYIFFVFLREVKRDNLKSYFFIFKSFFIFILGMFLTLVQLLPTYELMKLGFRVKLDYENFTQFSFSFKQIPMLFFPYIFGKINISQYKDVVNIFQSNYPEMGMYLGVFSFFISLLGLFNKNKAKIFWGIVALFSLILVFGKNIPLYKITYYIPIYNLFRIPTRNWIGLCFAFSILGGLGLDYIVKSKFKEFKKMSLIIIALILSFISGFFILYYFFKRTISSGGTLFLNYNVGFLSQSFSLNKSSVYIPLALFFVSLLFFIVLIFLKKRNYLKKKFMVIPLVLLIFFDLFSFGHDFEPFLNRDLRPLFDKNYYDTYSYISNDNEVFRVYPFFYNLSPYDYDLPVKDISSNLNIFYNIYNIAGYQPFYLKDYNQITQLGMIGAETNPNFDLISNNNVLSVLNTKYIIIPNELIQMFGKIPYLSKAGFKMSSDIINNKILGEYNNSSFIQFDEIDNSFMFNSNNNDLKIIAVPLNLNENTYYSIKFKIKKVSDSKPPEQITDKNIHFDFFGTKEGKVVYDNPEQEYMFPIESAGNDYKEYEVYINPDPVPNGADIYFRVFSWISSNYVIKDLTVSEFSAGKDANYTVVKQVKDSLLLKNNKFFPRFYFAKNILDVDNIGQVESNLWDKNYNPEEYTMVENYDLSKNKFNGYKSSEVYLLKYENNYVDLRVSMQEDGFMVFSDTYYPGWRAYIDGKETKIYKTNGIFKGINIPAGEHKIRFRFLPNSFIIGAAISGVTFIILIILLVFLVIPLNKRKRNKGSESKPGKIL